MHGRPRPSPAERRARRAAVDDPEDVLAAALRRLEVRAFSVDSLRRRLVEAGYQTGLVEGALERLTGLGLLDDLAFARAWVESRDRSRPRGSLALRTELRRKGIADDVVAAVLGGRDEGEPVPAEGGRRPPDAAPGADERAAAHLLARRDAVLRREPNLRRRQAKAYALLARNGFDPEVCSRTVLAWLTISAGTDDQADPLPG